jgi:hypothetical protein
LQFNSNVGCLPAIGAPMQAAIPWKRSKSPKAFVNFSRPSKSTRIMDLRDAKQAEIFNNKIEHVAGSKGLIYFPEVKASKNLIQQYTNF